MQTYQQAHAGQRPGPGGFFQSEWQAAATALKLTPTQLQQDLKSGKSIAAIAQTQNVPLQTVQDAMLAAAKTNLDKAVSSGKLTQAQETKMLADLQTRLPQMLNATPGQGHHFGRPGPHSAAPAQKPAA